jgi:hypothetical protein
MKGRETGDAFPGNPNPVQQERRMLTYFKPAEAGRQRISGSVSEAQVPLLDGIWTIALMNPSDPETREGWPICVADPVGERWDVKMEAFGDLIVHVRGAGFVGPRCLRDWLALNRSTVTVRVT